MKLPGKDNRIFRLFFHDSCRCFPFQENIYCIGFRFLWSRSTIQVIRFSRPASVFASKYARVQVFFTDRDMA